MTIRAFSAVATAVLLLSACVSAGDRLRQGRELERQGRSFEAALRYADALDKDEDLDEARVKLMEVGTTALERGLRGAARDLGTGRPVTAVAEFVRMDELLARSREAGVFLPAPDDYPERRAEGLLAWAAADLEAGRLQAAFRHAGQAMDFTGEGADGIRREARALRERALEEGTVGVAVLPVSATQPVREAAGAELEIHLADVLELGHLRRPPPFIAVVDPVAVRQAAREAARSRQPLTPRQVRRVLERVGADFGALVEVIEWTVSEEDAERFTRETRSRRGRAVTFQIEQGRLVYRAAVQLLLTDGAGRRIGTTTVRDVERGACAGFPDRRRGLRHPPLASPAVMGHTFRPPTSATGAAWAF